MNDKHEKFVDFEKCRNCEYEKLRDYESPCFMCLQIATNFESSTPVYFEPKEDRNDA